MLQVGCTRPHVVYGRTLSMAVIRARLAVSAHTRSGFDHPNASPRETRVRGCSRVHTDCVPRRHHHLLPPQLPSQLESFDGNHPTSCTRYWEEACTVMVIGDDAGCD